MTETFLVEPTTARRQCLSIFLNYTASAMSGILAPGCRAGAQQIYRRGAKTFRASEAAENGRT
jgi:hypothetical protein